MNENSEQLVSDCLTMLDCGKTGGMDIFELIEWHGKLNGYSDAAISAAIEYCDTI